ncbi:MAG: alpha/beta hydrolase [Weeksellaceae bacterium]|nr:alpha/beta hydrolase [Weeksellaceae bacterium]
MRVYEVSGLGVNQLAFENLKWPEGTEIIYLPWLQPEEDETLQHYAERMADQVNTEEDFILAGLSFGGIMVQEMQKFITPEKTILFSSAKSREELAPYMKLSAKTKAHRVLPMSFFTSDKLISYAVARRLYSRKMPSYERFFTFRDPYYLKWSIDKIVNWQTPQHSIAPIHHVHGNKDLVFPAKFIKNAEIIENGNHFMILQKHKEISNFLQKILKNS